MDYGEERASAPSQEREMPIWEELHLLAAGEIVVEVEHVKAHRTKKDKT